MIQLVTNAISRSLRRVQVDTEMRESSEERAVVIATQYGLRGEEIVQQYRITVERLADDKEEHSG